MPIAASTSTLASTRARSEAITVPAPKPRPAPRRTSLPARRLQAVADAPHGADQRRAVGVELLSQVADVGLQHAAVAPEVVVPDMVEQLRAGHHAARVEHQVAKQPELGRGQLDRLARAE